MPGSHIAPLSGRSFPFAHGREEYDDSDPEHRSYEKTPNQRPKKPDRWFAKGSEIEGRPSFFISREDIGTRGEFDVGLSLIETDDVTGKTGMSPSKYAYAALAVVAAMTEPLRRFELKPGEGYRAFGLRARDA